MTAGGDLVRLARGDADFPGAVVSLGALGVVVGVTLDVLPASPSASSSSSTSPRSVLDARW